MLRSYPQFLSLLMVFWGALIGVMFILSAWQNSTAYDSVLFSEFGSRELALQRTIRSIRLNRSERLPLPVPAKGIYISSGTAGSTRLEDLLSLVKETELNAVVIDIKDYSGWVSYDSNVPLANALGTEKPLIRDLPGLLKALHKEEVYAIARIQVFQDPTLAGKRPDLAIQERSGGVWRDFKGLAWLDPGSREVWDYTVALAKDAIAQGFDEVNFDYIRFPSDGRISEAVYTHGEGRSKTETINDFFAYLNESLKDEPAFISVDLFGMTLWSDSDFNIGQTLLGAAPYFDYLSPMVYPSHYADGFNGYANPALYPYEVVSKNLERGALALEGASSTAKFRPWLQDFDLGANYTPDMVRAQIRAAEEQNTFGWLLWNASSRYTVAALNAEGE